mgnify:CR=1 FL=1
MIAGVDPSLGAKDFTAIAWLESTGRHHRVIALARWKPADELDLLRQVDLEMARRPAASIAFDCTGLRDRITPLFTLSPLASRIPMYPVQVRPLQRQATQAENGVVQLPKRVLVDSLFGALKDGRFSCPSSVPLATVLQVEIRHFKTWQDPNGLTRYGAAPGHHDDIISAVSLAIFLSEHLQSAGTVNRFRSVNGSLPSMR